MALPVKAIYVAVLVQDFEEASRVRKFLNSRPIEEVPSEAEILSGYIIDNKFQED